MIPYLRTENLKNHTQYPAAHACMAHVYESIPLSALGDTPSCKYQGFKIH